MYSLINSTITFKASAIMSESLFGSVARSCF
jgi:hypothetical protein